MSFEERLKQYSLTKTDRCIAEYCLQNMEGLPLSSSAEIARQVNTSDVSVIRFVTKLGYKNFVEFKHEIQHELVQSQASLEEVSPIVRYISNHADDPTLVSGLDQMESYYQSSLSLIFHKNPPAVFEQAARLVLAASNRYVLGIRFRESIADLCSNLLRLSVPNVIHIPASDYKAFQISRDMSKDDCLIWFNFDQFTNFEEQMLEVVEKSGVRLIVVSNQRASKISLAADVFIQSAEHNLLPFYSSVGNCVIAEAIANAVINLSWDSSEPRLRNYVTDMMNQNK